MAIQAQMADGRILEFPDGTDPSVIQSTVKRLISESATTAAEKPATPAAPAIAGPTPGLLSFINEPKPQEPKKVYTGSVFDTQPFEPPFNPEEAEKLSRRAYAEKTMRLPPRDQEARETPLEQVERTPVRAAADTAISVLQGAVAIPKGITENIPFDNPLSSFFKDAYEAGEKSKSGYLRSKNLERAALIQNVRKNQGELAASRAAFNTMFSPSGADIIAQGAGSLIPSVGLSVMDLGVRSMMAMNALANAGDSAQQTAARLAEMPPEEWSKNGAYQSLRKQGLDHRDAVRMLAPVFALPSQAVGGFAGALSGSTGFERALAGGASRAAGARAGRAGAELLGEEIETLAPMLTGNITQRAIDKTTSPFEGLGQAAVETAAAAGPGAGLAAAISRPEAPTRREAPQKTAEQIAREKGFLVGQPEVMEEPVAPDVAPEVPDAITRALQELESASKALPDEAAPIAEPEEIAEPTTAAKELPEVPTAAPAVETKIEEPPPENLAVSGLGIQEVPISDLKLSKDVPQFKIGATEKGVVEPLGGKFERTGVAPIQVWERNDGTLEIISGRHRFDLAQRSGEQTIPAQIHREADGFGKVQAAILDAELNIRDGQGKVKDYVNYFKESGITREDAESRGLLARATGKRSYTIANQGSDELVAAVRADQVGDEAAYYIALNAPGDSRLQGVGIRAIQDGKSANTATNMMQAVKAMASEQDTTTDMFGFDDSAIKEAEEMAKIASQKQKEVQTRLAAISGAAKNPSIAKAEGIDIKDPEAVKRRIDELRQRKADWDNWSTNPELVAEIRDARGVSEPFLKQQTEEDLRAQQTEREAAEKAEADVLREEERKAAAPKAEEFVLTGSAREADEAAARGQQSFLDIGRSVLKETEKRAPSVTRRAKTLRRQYRDGKISEGMYIMSMNSAIDAAEQARLDKDIPERQRGADLIRERILAAKRRGELSEKAADMAEWFILKNPSLVDDLGISIRTPREGQESTSGQYMPLPRIMVLMKDASTDDTPVHEMLHHLERMMPMDIRDGIRKEWAKQLSRAKKAATTDADKKFFDLLVDYHYGDAKQSDFLGAVQLIKDGEVEASNYRYVNPSEFWAETGADIVTGRYDAIRGAKLQRLKNWLKELAQKLKSVFGLPSSAPIIRALDSLSKGDGRYRSNRMLSEEALPALESIKPSTQKQPAAKKKLEDTWLLGKDEAGNVGFGPGAKAYSVVSDITNKVLDKFAMRPMSPELARAVRDMQAQLDVVQGKLAEVSSEMSKLSPDEREMISDVIEGELKAGVNPPQHVLNLAAAIQSIMSRQSEELVDLGMLSKEAANRWDNKYLPRFYERNLRDDVNAWAKAAREIFMKQPMMRGIKGSSLRARGLFEVIDTKDLQDWIDQGWEQRDPKFDPKTSTETVVWRDYTKQEREDMGEIRDAMFRFVMGYNASQRDISLGRLYRDLAKNYASKTPRDGYVLVPESKVEDTSVTKYGDLAGLYVPKEIMDHLSANDHAMAEGILKIYRAGLSKWKEGKTVLNPVSHANNVISNLTMAHFAGVSYWEAHKYAAAIKDFVTKSPMIKEAKDVGLFGGTFSQEEIMKSMPPELRNMANMTESQLSRFGERIWDTLAFTVEAKGKKYGARPAMQWAYENEDMFFRYLIYRDARSRGMDPKDARDYSQEYIFRYDDLPKGARAIRDYGMPFFSYTYKVVPVLARTALVYPWRYAAPATVAYTANALMYAMAANLGADEDDWWGKVLYKYVTDEEFRNRAKAIEAEEREYLPEWMKGHSGIMATPKAIRMGMDDATGLPMFLDISRIFPGGDLLDANNNAGGVAIFQPLTPSNPVLTTLVAMLGNRDLFLGKDVTKKTDTDAEKAQKRAAWMWKQITPAISVGNYHFDRGMNTIANITGKPITVDAGPMGVVSYTGVGKDGLPVQPKHAMLQTMGIKIRPYDVEVSRSFDASAKRQILRELDFEISRINRQESKGVISSEAASLEREKLIEKKRNISMGLTLGGEEKD